MALAKATVDRSAFNAAASLPYELRLVDFESAMQDVYDYYFDVNTLLVGKGLKRLEAMLRPAIMSGMLSDMITSSLARHSRTLTENRQHNGHPDLIVQGRYIGNATMAGDDGVEIKTTRKPGGAVDTHGARSQWLCVFVYQVDDLTEPEVERAPVRFTEIYLGQVLASDFRKNGRGDLGTRTATLNRDGLKKLRTGWIYRSSA